MIHKKRPGPQPIQNMKTTFRKKILNWRDRYGWGPTRIEGHLKEHYDIRISHRQIYKLFCETNRNKPISKQRKTWGKKTEFKFEIKFENITKSLNYGLLFYLWNFKKGLCCILMR